MKPSAAQIEAAARALYELNPYEEGPEYLDGMPINGRTKPHIYSWDELLELAEPVQDEFREMARVALTAALT